MSLIITIDELKGKIDNSLPEFILVDVRENWELEYGMIPTAISIPLDEVESVLSDSNKYDKNKEIIFYCRTGTRSLIASNVAIKLGFVNVKNFKGSIWEWSEIDNNVKRYGPAPQ